MIKSYQMDAKTLIGGHFYRTNVRTLLHRELLPYERGEMGEQCSLDGNSYHTNVRTLLHGRVLLYKCEGM